MVKPLQTQLFFFKPAVDAIAFLQYAPVFSISSKTFTQVVARQQRGLLNG